jgi:hypothetical protein
MIVGNEEITVVFLLHFDEVPERPEVVAQVKVSGRPDAAEYCFHGAKVGIFQFAV